MQSDITRHYDITTQCVIMIKSQPTSDDTKQSDIKRQGVNTSKSEYKTCESLVPKHDNKTHCDITIKLMSIQKLMLVPDVLS